MSLTDFTFNSTLKIPNSTFAINSILNASQRSLKLPSRFFFELDFIYRFKKLISSVIMEAVLRFSISIQKRNSKLKRIKL